MKTVNIQGVGEVNFPDEMDDAAISRAIETDILPKIQAPSPASNTFDPNVVGVFAGQEAPTVDWARVGDAASKFGLQTAAGLGMTAAAAPAIALNPMLAIPSAGLIGGAVGQVGQLYDEAKGRAAPMELPERFAQTGVDVALSAPFGAADYIGAKNATPFLPEQIPVLKQAAKDVQTAKVAEFQTRTPGIYVGVGDTKPLTPVGQMMWKSPRLQKAASWVRNAADTLTAKMRFPQAAGTDEAGNMLTDLKDVVLDTAEEAVLAPNTRAVLGGAARNGIKITPRADPGLQSLNKLIKKVDVPAQKVDTDTLMDLYRFTRSTGKWDKLTTEEQRFFQELGNAVEMDLGQMDDMAAAAFERSTEFVRQNRGASELQKIMERASQNIKGPGGEQVTIFNPRRFVNYIDEAEGLLKPYARRSGQPGKPNLLTQEQIETLKQFRDDMALLADDLDSYASMVKAGDMAPGGFMQQVMSGKGIAVGGLTAVPGSRYLMWPAAGADAALSYFITNPSSKAYAVARGAKAAAKGATTMGRYTAPQEATKGVIDLATENKRMGSK